MSAPAFSVQGVSVSTLALEDCARVIARGAEGTAPSSVFTLNLDHVVKLRTSPDFRNAYHDADLVVPDGFPIVLAGQIQGFTCSRVAGSDLIAPLCRHAALQRRSVFLFGSTFATLAKSARHLRNAYPALDIAGVAAPPLGFDPTSDAARRYLDMIKASGAAICFLALGAPKQELFAHVAKSAQVPCTFVCIGAGLDFIAGQQQRAPVVMQRLRLEWAWRLLQEPTRLAKRYLLCLGVLPAVLAESLRLRLTSSSR